ncbi:MAG: PDDEXK nuclease domain-containing protein [Tepidisphaeraceae bacterium]|jgi:predicted nuclease of restriction endonuclease-like (RecB) superfamily
MKRAKEKVVPATKVISRPSPADYGQLVVEISNLLEQARRGASRSVNAILTATYWEIGRRIVEHEQRGKARAEYGKELLAKLGNDLTRQHGRGFSARNLRQMRAFYLGWEIWQTPSAKFEARVICPALSEVSTSPDAGMSAPGNSEDGKTPTPLKPLSIVQTLSAKSDRIAFLGIFPLPWSHYVRLLAVEKPSARAFYESEAIRGGWSVRQLDRQISTQFFERSVHSKNPTALLARGQNPRPEDAVSLEDELRDPYFLEFLNLTDEYSESELEAALVRHLETFLLELGAGFAFVARQKRIRIGDEWYRIDLLLFHRRLRCLVVIDLKIGKFTPADAGQMNLYLNYVRERMMETGENEPVGLILCSAKNEAVVHYAMGGIKAKVFASHYLTELPDPESLRLEILSTKRAIEARAAAKGQHPR